MLRTSLALLAICVLAPFADAQRIRLNPKARIDTLWVQLVLNDGLEADLKRAYEDRTREGIAEFNRKPKYGFIVQQTSEPRDNCLTITIDSVHIATKKAQHGAFLASFVGLLLLPTGLIIAESPIIIFFWASGMSRVHGGFDISANLRAPNYVHPGLQLNSNAGWFKGEERKRALVADAYELGLERMLKKLRSRLRKR